jgi:hypothetical protein
MQAAPADASVARMCVHPVRQSRIASHSDEAPLRGLAIVVGLAWSLVFVAIGHSFELQLYGDGSIFSYAVALQEAWAYHWHNISGRIAVYLYAHAPAEFLVALTGSARAGIAAYGLLLFAAPLVGLAAAYWADRSGGRVIFGYACLSTAVLAPLVFGSPTEMWMAHALFWPALALAHFARRGIGGAALVFAALVALVLTHEGALVLAATIVLTLAPRGTRDGKFLRGLGAFALALAIWAAVKALLPPDAYFASIVGEAATNFIDPANLTCPLFLLLLGALAAYAAACLALWRIAPARAHLYAATIVALALAGYWLWFDRELHTEYRYYLRTALLYFTPPLGALAALVALRGEGALRVPIPILPRIMDLLAGAAATRVFAGAVLLATLVHAVETAKFVSAWSQYKAAVRALATGMASDPALGDARFVSSARVGAALNRLSWFSTTPYLSVLLAPDFAPTRLAVDPEGGYFWLTCAAATASERGERAIPVQSRRLIRIYSCLHR